jgi:hypothetical protein
VRWRPRGRRRSVGRGGHRPAIEPRKPIPGCRRCFERGRQHEQTHHRERLVDPAWSKNLACADALCAGTGRSRDRPFGNRRRSASGRRGAVADDARSREVRLCHSSWEADEQSRATGCGAGGAKGRDAVSRCALFLWRRKAQATRQFRPDRARNSPDFVPEGPGPSGIASPRVKSSFLSVTFSPCRRTSARFRSEPSAASLWYRVAWQAHCEH